ncbi:MetQ/NlpA family ABC transporter substrate-binding protein [Streptomyces sp. NBC_01167]|uniref:MetQ/NlpA family ABC transporter substrate-binding protein n=1 Tax=unclassified Streptomyces TaxID=2593676 RepID=UPI00367666BA|nr:MetQ/NlpA family ABC transporter substrate-binding protein [Streptomyces sp. NBC_01167]
MRKQAIAAVAATGALALALTACGSGPGKGGGDAKTLVVGATAVPAGEVLDFIAGDLAEKEGLDLQVKEFTDYVLPNTALAEGQLDANLYQNAPFLENFNTTKGTDLVPVTEAYLPPMGVYAEKLDNIAELPAGATVAVPNETTNEGRALLLLASQGVITLKEGAGVTASPADITSNPKKLTFKELEPAQLPRVLGDVDAAVINSNYALDAGLDPKKDAVLLESAEGNKYTNVLAVKKGDEDDPRVKKLVTLLHSPEVKKFIQDTYKGSVLPAAAG